MGNCIYKLQLCGDKDMLRATYKETPKFIPDVTHGKVIKVYDGDTITIAGRVGGLKKLGYGGRLCKFSVRLNNIDTPEMKGSTEGEKKMAKLAQKALEDYIIPEGKDSNGVIVQLKNVTFEKYGRLLADVYYNGVCLNDWMIDEKFAVKYDGGTKKNIDWEKYYSTKLVRIHKM
jgi:micrococcal nuclease